MNLKNKIADTNIRVVVVPTSKKYNTWTEYIEPIAKQNSPGSSFAAFVANFTSSLNKKLEVHELDSNSYYTYDLSKAVAAANLNNIKTSQVHELDVSAFSKSETIYAQVLGTTEYEVILKCLINKELKSFQTRKFDITPFKDAVDLTPNSFVEIIIYTKPGEKRFTYKNFAVDKELKEIFEPKNYFEGLENTPFFKSSQQD